MKISKPTKYFVALGAIAAGYLLASCSATQPAVTVLGGLQTFEEDAAEDADAPTIGAQFEYKAAGQRDTSVTSELGFLLARQQGMAWLTPTSDAFNVSLQTLEVYTGLRQDWHLGRAMPYLGAGFDAVVLNADALGGSDQDVSFGGYAKGGLRFRITDNLSIGAEARYRMVGDFRIGNDSTEVVGDLSGLAGLLTLTWSF